MADARELAADVFRTVCHHLAGRADDLGRLVEAEVPFDGWLEAEAYLACRRAGDRFAEVEFRPTYGSEGVAGADGGRGGLRVGGVGEPGHHLWLFAEFMTLADDWQARTEAAAARLLRLGWKRSAAILFVVGREEVGRRPLTAAVRIALPGGGETWVQAFDVKRDPADTLIATGDRQA